MAQHCPRGPDEIVDCAVGSLASNIASIGVDEMVTRAKRVTFFGLDAVDWLVLVVGIGLTSFVLLLAYDPAGDSAPSPILEHAGTANPPVPL